MHTFAIKSVWLDEKITDICSSSLVVQGINCPAAQKVVFCTSTLKSFRLLAHSLH